jgi:hypothetical protein
MRFSKFRAIWIGVVALIIVASIFHCRAVSTYDAVDLKDYNINLQAETFGIAISAALSLIVVVVSLQIESNLRQGALSSARFPFLRTEVESFKEALIRYIDTFRLGQGATAQLSQARWESFDKKFWPQRCAINRLTEAVRGHDLAGMYTVRAVKLSINGLWDSFQKIVAASATNIFEGKEHLVRRAVFSVLFELGSLRGMMPTVILGKDDDDQVELSGLAQRIKMCAETCGRVLEDMAELAASVKTNQ